MTIISGCRLTPGGLHLGHLNGCFLSRVQETVENQDYIFVVSDSLKGVSASSRTRSDLIRDVYSCEAYVGRLLLVFESDLRKSLARVFNSLTRANRARNLMKVHPDRNVLFEPGVSFTIDDLLFPIHQASYILGFGARHVFMNDDNEELVRFARKAIRVAGYPPVDLPQLVYGPCRRVPGSDGLRMAKSNRNTLALGASDRAIYRYSGQLVSLLDSPGIGDRSNLVYSFLESYLECNSETVIAMFKEDPRALSEVVSQKLFSLVAPYRDSRAVLGDWSKINTRIGNDREEALSIIERKEEFWM